MKILIVTYYFYPEITPRAFRAFELAKEFGKRNIEIDVIIPKNNYSYTGIKNKFNINILPVKSGFFLNKNKFISKNFDNNTKNNFRKDFFLKNKFFKKFFNIIYFEGKITEYFLPLYNYLLKINKKYDLVISIGLPFIIHLAVGLSRRKNELAKCYVADYGDPFSNNPASKKLFYLKQLEKYVLQYFDYVSIPIEEAKQAYKEFEINHKLVVIPQGYDFSNIKILKYKKHSIPHFAYAGNFYPTIRNPNKLLDFLVSYDGNFVFDIYTNWNNLENRICLEPYIKKLKGKLFIKTLLPREELIKKLSTYDFLININNISQVQLPSKLIDYMLTKRPIFSFFPNQFDKNIFIQYLNGNYILSTNLVLDNYNIKNVANKFLKLYLEKQ